MLKRTESSSCLLGCHIQRCWCSATKGQTKLFLMMGFSGDPTRRRSTNAQWFFHATSALKRLLKIPSLSHQASAGPRCLAPVSASRNQIWRRGWQRLGDEAPNAEVLAQGLAQTIHLPFSSWFFPRCNSVPTRMGRMTQLSWTDPGQRGTQSSLQPSYKVYKTTGASGKNLSAGKKGNLRARGSCVRSAGVCRGSRHPLFLGSNNFPREEKLFRYRALRSPRPHSCAWGQPTRLRSVWRCLEPEWKLTALPRDPSPRHAASNTDSVPRADAAQLRLRDPSLRARRVAAERTIPAARPSLPAGHLHVPAPRPGSALLFCPDADGPLGGRCHLGAFDCVPRLGEHRAIPARPFLSTSLP